MLLTCLHDGGLDRRLTYVCAMYRWDEDAHRWHVVACRRARETLRHRRAGIVFRVLVDSRVSGSFRHLGQPALICLCPLRVAKEGAPQAMKHFNIADSNAASQLTNTLPRRLSGWE